jgi:hypothetical protein
MHGGKSTGPKTLQGKAMAAAAPLKHGFYSERFKGLMTKDEEKAYKEVVAALDSDEYGAADRLMKEGIALLAVQAARSEKPAPILQEMRSQLKDLKASRVGREGEEGKDSAEVVVNFQWGEPEKKTKQKKR